MRIFVAGDIHAEFEKLNDFINKKKPELILQCGDFGYWPKFDGKYDLGKSKLRPDGTMVQIKKWYQCGIKNKNTKIMFCDGNHEDHASLKKLKNLEICPNIFYVPRGSVITLSDGRNVLFIGGAESEDRDSRTEGVDWFPEEKITQEDIDRINTDKIDIVLSHTCPREFLEKLDQSSIKKFNDQSIDLLSNILNSYKPKLWYFGHFHQNRRGVFNNTKWFALNMISNSGWFEKLQM